MKWTFLKRRSKVQKLEIQVSPASGTYFDPANSNTSNTTSDDKGDAEEIPHKQLLGQMGSMNLVDEEGQDIGFREGSNPAFTHPADTAQQQLPTFSSDPDEGVQPSSPLGPSAHSEILPPENLNTTLLQAANALERVEAHIEQCTASLRYFLDLGSGNRPNDFADVKRSLTDIRTLVNSSAPVLLIVRKLAAGFRAFGTPVAASSPNGQGEANCVNIIEVPLKEPSTDSQTTLKVDQEQQDEQKPVDVGSTSNEQDEANKNNSSTLQVGRTPTQEQSDEQNRVDPCSTVQQNEQKRIDMVLSEIQIILKEGSPIPKKPELSTETPPCPLWKQDGLDANMTIASKTTIPPNPHQVGRKPNERTMTDPITHEIEALLAISKELIPEDKT